MQKSGITANEHYYVIGTIENTKDKTVFSHELAHALYYLDSSYKKSVDKILDKMDVIVYNTIISNLIDNDYPQNSKILNDEINNLTTIIIGNSESYGSKKRLITPRRYE